MHYYEIDNSENYPDESSTVLAHETQFTFDQFSDMVEAAQQELIKRGRKVIADGILIGVKVGQHIHYDHETVAAVMCDMYEFKVVESIWSVSVRSKHINVLEGQS